MFRLIVRRFLEYLVPAFGPVRWFRSAWILRMRFADFLQISGEGVADDLRLSTGADCTNMAQIGMRASGRRRSRRSSQIHSKFSIHSTDSGAIVKEIILLPTGRSSGTPSLRAKRSSRTPSRSSGTSSTSSVSMPTFTRISEPSPSAFADFLRRTSARLSISGSFGERDQTIVRLSSDGGSFVDRIKSIGSELRTCVRQGSEKYEVFTAVATTDDGFETMEFFFDNTQIFVSGVPSEWPGDGPSNSGGQATGTEAKQVSVSHCTTRSDNMDSRREDPSQGLVVGDSRENQAIRRIADVIQLQILTRYQPRAVTKMLASFMLLVVVLVSASTPSSCAYGFPRRETKAAREIDLAYAFSSSGPASNHASVSTGIYPIRTDLNGSAVVSIPAAKGVNMTSSVLPPRLGSHVDVPVLMCEPVRSSIGVSGLFSRLDESFLTNCGLLLVVGGKTIFLVAEQERRKDHSKTKYVSYTQHIICGL